MTHSLCELSVIEPTHSAVDSDHERRRTRLQLPLLRLSDLNPTDWVCLPAQRCEGLSFIQQRVVRSWVHVTINPTDAIYSPGAREVTSHIVCYRWDQVVIHAHTHVGFCVFSIISPRQFSAGTAGVCDRFHHLDRSVLMNILITSANARACWVSSSAFPGDKYGKMWMNMESAPAGVRIHFFALRKTTSSFFGGAFAILMQCL